MRPVFPDLIQGQKKKRLQEKKTTCQYPYKYRSERFQQNTKITLKDHISWQSGTYPWMQKWLYVYIYVNIS